MAGLLLPDPVLLLMTPLAFVVAFGWRRKQRYWVWPISAVLVAVAVVGIGASLAGGSSVPVVHASGLVEVQRSRGAEEQGSSAVLAAAAQARGRPRDLQATVAELLVELEGW